MEEVFKKVKLKGFKQYIVSNYGTIINTKNQRILVGSLLKNRSLLVTLYAGAKQQTIVLHKLVSLHFNKHSLEQATAYHKNYNRVDNYNKNLKPCTRGQAISRSRVENERNKDKIRGIYTWNIGHNKYRVAIGLRNKKVKTIGYYKDFDSALGNYVKAYKELFGVYPFTKQEYNLHV